MIKKRIIATITGLAVAAMIVVPSSASALTSAELQVQINALMAQLAALQQQLTDMGGGDTGGTVTGCTITSFTSNLKVGDSGASVKCLQIVLNSASDTQLSAGVGSPGQETSYFGPKTRSAVITFQEKYADVVLAVYGLTSGTGYVGTTTRAKLDSLLGGTTPTDPTDPTDPVDPVDPGPAGSLIVTLASNTPSTQTVPANATAAGYNVPATMLNFTAGTGDVTVTGLKILRSGVSQDAAISSIKIFDEEGNQLGTSQSIGSSHKANFNNISFTVPANTTKTLTVKASFTASVTYSGNILALGIESADDITSNATSVSGSFALAGNSITLTSSVTIGTATLYNGSLGTRNGTDLNVDPNDKDIRFTQVKISAGSGEGFTVQQVTAVKNGTVASSDVVNIRLVNDNTGETLGTVTSLNADGRAVFTGLDVSVSKGLYVELSIIADMNDSGSGRTVAFDLHDGSAYTIEVVGDTYGFGLTPSRNNFCASAGTCTTQTVNQGYVTIQKSASTPATGYIAIGASQVEIAAFDFTVYGEPINVTSTQVLIDPSTAEADQFTNITGYNDAGEALFGPKDGTTAVGGTDETLTFTDGYTLPIGINTIHIKANVATDVLANDQVDFEIPANTLVAKGAISGRTTYTTSTTGTGTVAPTAARTGNAQTVKGPALVVITAGTPVASSVVANAQNEIFAYFDLDATSSGEDVKVTQMLVADTTDGSTANTNYTEIINLELWGDPDTTDSVDEFVRLETSSSTATQASTGVTTFTFKVPLRIKKGTITRLTLLADVTSSATNLHQHLIISATDNVVSTGWDTGTTVGETYAGLGQKQTATSVGLLKIIKSADIPVKAQFVSGTTGNVMMKYRMYASYEDIGVTELKVATEGTIAAIRAGIDRVKIYYEGSQIGASSGYVLDAGGDALISLDAGVLVVPKDTYTDLEIRVDLGAKAQLTDNTAIEIGLADYDATAASRDDSSWGDDAADSAAGQAYHAIATGAKSGTTIVNDESTGYINSTATSAGVINASYAHQLYDGILVVSKNSSTPSGTQSAGADSELLRLNLEAVGDDITINEMEFCISGTADGVNGTGDVTIKSSNLGTTYATLTQSGYDAYWDTLIAASTYYPADPGIGGGSCFSFGNAAQTANTIVGKTGKNIEPFSTSLQIAEGTTKTVKIFGDTTNALTTLNLQLKLQANTSTSYKATTSGIDWQNNSGNAVDEIITKNTPITGGALEY